MGVFGLPQRGKGAEVAEIEWILCSLCLSAPLRQSRRLCRLSNDSAVRGLMRFLEIVMDQMSSRAKKDANLNWV